MMNMKASNDLRNNFAACYISVIDNWFSDQDIYITSSYITIRDIVIHPLTDLNRFAAINCIHIL